MFFALGMFALSYTILFAYCSFPLNEQVIDTTGLQNQTTFLDLDLTSVQAFTALIPANKVEI